jgi:excinuclease ABC subunit B
VRDDPLARQQAIEDRAGAYAGTKKYGAAANLPPVAGGGGMRARKPTLDEMGPGIESIPARPASRQGPTGGRPGTRVFRGKPRR